MWPCRQALIMKLCRGMSRRVYHGPPCRQRRSRRHQSRRTSRERPAHVFWDWHSNLHDLDFMPACPRAVICYMLQETFCHLVRSCSNSLPCGLHVLSFAGCRCLPRSLQLLDPSPWRPWLHDRRFAIPKPSSTQVCSNATLRVPLSVRALLLHDDWARNLFPLPFKALEQPLQPLQPIKAQQAPHNCQLLGAWPVPSLQKRFSVRSGRCCMRRRYLNYVSQRLVCLLMSIIVHRCRMMQPRHVHRSRYLRASWGVLIAVGRDMAHASHAPGVAC